MPKYDETEVRNLAKEAIKQLGSQADPETIERVVKAALAKIEKTAETPRPPIELQHKTGTRIIITAFGKNQVGILAGLTDILARNKCDVLDLTQKILQEFFTIMLLVDISKSEHEFEKIKDAVIARGEELNLKVVVQHEAIFNTMHRI
ncbi:MAG: ACT domain-containing protein [Calditrichaceae bacterium]|nr:ACT domain-containing protein [Calditrichaceae bacterium]MBN2709034.1 ACT domain-containing protein [Calditrichaceae bacterium]RQV96993.1 MAG: ACT domain-containing protein [Calditrichota bacterium]